MTQRYRHDDDPYRFRAVWLGLRGYTWPVEAEYLQWGLALAFFTVYEVALLTLGIGAKAVTPVWALCAAAVTVKAIEPLLDHDRSLRGWVQVLHAELDTPRPVTARPTRRPVARYRTVEPPK